MQVQRPSSASYSGNHCSWYFSLDFTRFRVGTRDAVKQSLAKRLAHDRILHSDVGADFGCVRKAAAATTAAFRLSWFTNGTGLG
jgi:hypothetical protein